MTDEDILTMVLTAANHARTSLCSISGHKPWFPGRARRITIKLASGRRVTVAEPALESMTVRELSRRIGGSA